MAGQVPPPLAGQHVAVQTLLESLRADGRFDVEHLPYAFSPTMEGQGRLGAGKAFELVRIAGRLIRLRARGRIDVLVHPVGGTSAGSTARDVVVVALSRLLVGRTVLQFHGAGHGRKWPGHRGLGVRVARRVLGGADAAIVHAQANAVDPEFLGIEQVFVAAHHIHDTYDPGLVAREGDELRVLYVGHVGPHRGTPELLEAFARLTPDDPGLRLVLAGNPVGGFSEGALRAQVSALGLVGRVDLPGTVRGQAKDELFGRAHVFVFPTVFEAESFGLVLAEALMWGLPIAATDWRGNREVLDGAHAIVHAYEPDLTGQIEGALREVIGHLRDGSWPKFLPRNREQFEARFCLGRGPSPAVTAIAAVAGLAGGDPERAFGHPPDGSGVRPAKG